MSIDSSQSEEGIDFGASLLVMYIDRNRFLKQSIDRRVTICYRVRNIWVIKIATEACKYALKLSKIFATDTQIKHLTCFSLSQIVTNA